MKINEVDQLYQRYGYEIQLKLSSKKARVYTLKKGVYFGADIVYFDKNLNLDSLAKQLSDSGFACRLKHFNKIEEAENFLFDSFFHSSQLNQRLLNKYNLFTANQTELINVPYEYIPVSYILENEEFNATKNLIESILNKINSNGAQLIIIEAAAGFGKTCTSYEVLQSIAIDYKNLSPIFTELSRDRKAAIFKHILQDVIVNEFHSLLDENLVIHEIQKGKIPLIIDGFDELLSKEQDKGNSEFEQVETMLSTIGDLLTENAKIILTGRKTAIFSGDSFDDWINKNPNEFEVSRFLINPPQVKDWLDDSKLLQLKEKEIPINDVANPVLLAFLRSLSEDQFLEAIKNPTHIVEKYFDAILNREQERQELNIEPQKQKAIFKKLASSMAEFDITSDTKSWIKEFIQDENYEILEIARKSYPLAKRPSLDELTNTLSNHALLDRKGRGDNIGFVNDFIFGTFIGEAIEKGDISEVKDISNHMIELATTAFQFQDVTNKNALYEKVKSKTTYSPSERFAIEYLLKKEIISDFEDASFNDISISSIKFENSSQFKRCVFANCVFEDTYFSGEAFENTSFVNCVFHNCESSENCSTSICILLLNCNDYDSGFIENIDKSIVEIEEETQDLRSEILLKFFDSANRPRHKKISIVIAEFPAESRGQVSKEINRLKSEKLLRINGNNAFLTDDSIQMGQKLLLQ